MLAIRLIFVIQKKYQMKKLFFLIVSVVTIAFNVNSQNYTVGDLNDTIDVNTVWSYDTVFVDTSLTILDGFKLTINPGTKIIFNGFHKFNVEGCLIAVGTPTDSIIFTVADTTGYYDFSHTGWDGIEILNDNGDMLDNDTSHFAYCQFWYGYNKDDDWYSGTGGAITIGNGMTAIIEKSLFQYNTTILWGGAIGIFYDAVPVIDSCSFIQNNAIYDPMVADGGGGAIAIGHYVSASVFDQTIISNCYFYKNSSMCDEYYGGGGAVKISGRSDALVYNCRFIENNTSYTGGALIVSGYCQPYIINNLFANNTADANGGAVAVKYYAGGYHLNNTFYNNYSGGNGGAYSIGCMNDSIFFANNIIYNNDDLDSDYPDFYIDYEDSNMKFYNNIIESGLASYTDIIQAGNSTDDPMWLDPAANDFRIACGSPAIDAGIDTLSLYTQFDIIGMPRMINGLYDMGAYETQLPSAVALGADYTICSNESTTLDAGAGYTSYLWSTTETTQSIEVTADDEYIVIAANEYLCETTDTINITVHQAPLAIAGSDLVNDCALSDTLAASQPEVDETGIWTILSGGTGSFEDNAEYNTLFTADNIGTYLLVWTVEDLLCTSADTVTVSFNEDTTDPTITCAAGQTIDLNAGETFYLVQGTEFDPSGTDDNCGVASVENDFNQTATLAGAQLPVGTNAIVWTVTDDSGNSQTCSIDVVVNPYVGIAGASDNGISVFPNPTNGIINISNHHQVIENIILTDLNGRTINSFNGNNIDITNVPEGIYFLKIQTAGAVIVEKIVKK
jgi:hypothetical protein